MIITYLRSSSYTCHEMCQMKYFLIYGLGYKEPANKKAEKGTVVHKFAEILGHIKKLEQDGLDTYEDDVAGIVDRHNYTLDDLFEKCYNHYTSLSPHKWEAADKRECRRWCDKAIEFNGGEFDPRNMNIIKAEQPFDIEIPHDWARYNYTLDDGSEISGSLAIKGTIDQVSRLDDDLYQILDWKTGKRWNWAHDHAKDYSHLQNDPQLMMYYYAAQHLYPEISEIEVCIYFINDGGPYRLCFSPEDIPRIEDMLKKKFEEIKTTEMPEQNKSWKCKKFCHFGKNSFTGTHVRPIVERRSGQVTPLGQEMTMCEQTQFCLQNRGMPAVIQHMSAPNFNVDYYQKPGEAGDGSSK